jgi:nucleoside 2-deoxyribosyltransferase
MKVYIAGKITGHPTYKEEFKNAEELFKKRGDVVINPAFMPEGFEQSEYHHVNMAMIDICEAVFFLPTWKDSKGAHLEMGYAKGTGKKVIFAEKLFERVSEDGSSKDER